MRDSFSHLQPASRDIRIANDIDAAGNNGDNRVMSDAELVSSVLAGNTARFEALVDRYLPMVRALCAIYGVSAKDVEVSRLLDLSQGYVGRTLPILLAVAGNALKAFPGVGTIAGGATHAVAYGLIFDALGRGLSGALAEGGELRPAVAAQKFRENLGEDLRARTIRMARLAVEAQRQDRD